MSTEENKASMRRAIDEGWNQGNVAVFDELAVSNYVHHDPSSRDALTLEDFKQWVTETRNAFPDLHITTEDMIADEDKVVVRLTSRGTNTGDIVTPMHIPATGKQVTTTSMVIVQYAGGKAVEGWSQGDDLGVYQQLGIIPAPEQVG